jgi:hypothetical protein
LKNLFILTRPVVTGSQKWQENNAGQAGFQPTASGLFVEREQQGSARQQEQNRAWYCGQSVTESIPSQGSSSFGYVFSSLLQSVSRRNITVDDGILIRPLIRRAAARSMSA